MTNNLKKAKRKVKKAEATMALAMMFYHEYKNLIERDIPSSYTAAFFRKKVMDCKNNAYETAKTAIAHIDITNDEFFACEENDDIMQRINTLHDEYDEISKRCRPTTTSTVLDSPEKCVIL